MLYSVLWLLQMGIGRSYGMLTRLCLRTIPLHRQRMKSSASMRAVMLLSGYAFFPFKFCSGLFWWSQGIGSQAAIFLCALAFLELRQHDAIRECAGLAPLSPSDCSQFCTRCFRQASTRISAAWQKLLACVLLELLRYLHYLTSSSLLCFQLPLPC